MFPPDANAYRQQLMRVSRKIQDFKESCQLRTLSQEQTALESELRGFESNLPKYEKVIGSVGKPTFAGSAMENKRRHDYKEIHDFHALIAKTGRHRRIRLRTLRRVIFATGMRVYHFVMHVLWLFDEKSILIIRVNSMKR